MAGGSWQAAEGAAGLRPWLEKKGALLCLSRLTAGDDARVAALKGAVAAAGDLPYELVEWHSPAGEAAVAVALGTPEKDGVALLAVTEGKLLDALPVAAGEDVDTRKAMQFAALFGRHVKPVEPKKQLASAAGLGGQVKVLPPKAGLATTQQETLKIDVAKMVTQGQDLLRKGQGVYAAKFFAKALGVLDAVRDERIEQSEPADDNVDGSVADVLGWATIAQTVVGNRAEAAQAAERLRGKPFSAFAVPLSTPAQALALDTIVAAGGVDYQGDLCSLKKLEPLLKDDPKNAELRTQLLVTLFLSGNAERALTEALKLRALKHSAGDAAFDALSTFLGDAHPLVAALNAPAAPPQQTPAA